MKRMLNIWGVCTMGAGTYDQMTRWDLCCTFFRAGDARRTEDIEQCCANCLYWFVFDEHLIWPARPETNEHAN